MSDNRNNLTLYQLSKIQSDSTTIPAHGHLILWADGDIDQGAHHLGFRLSKDGEFLALTYVTDSDTIVLDSLTFGAQQEDVSWGRVTDGNKNWKFFDAPTPGTSNGQGSMAPGSVQLPTQYALHQNFPNPFNPGTTIRFDVPKQSDISLTIWDIMGRRVKTLAEKTYQPGYYSIYWNATNEQNGPVAAGLYFYQLKSGNTLIGTHKMILVK